MKNARLKIISGGRDGLAERRRVPRRPVPEPVSLVTEPGDAAADAGAVPAPRRARRPAAPEQTGPPRRRAADGSAAPAEPSPAVRAEAARAFAPPRRVPAPRASTRPGALTWVFTVVMIAGCAIALFFAHPLLGAGLAAIGVAGLIAPPRRPVEPNVARVATVLSGAGLALVAVGMLLGM